MPAVEIAKHCETLELCRINVITVNVILLNFQNLTYLFNFYIITLARESCVGKYCGKSVMKFTDEHCIG